jgi:hypothetical protein
MAKGYYKTNSFYLSAFLYAQDVELISIDKTDPKRAVFNFNNSPEVERLAESFNFGKECLVDARKFGFAIKSLKSKLYD